MRWQIRRLVPTAILALVSTLGLAAWLVGRGGEDGAGRDEAGAEKVGSKGVAGRSGRAGPEVGRTPLDAVQQPLGTIAGEVRDIDGAGIPQARVCARPRGSDAAPPESVEPRCAAADASGRDRIAELPPRGYTLSASRRGYQPSESLPPTGRNPVVLSPGQAVDGVDVVLARGGAEVTGVVRDLSGGSVAGAVVSMRRGLFGGANGFAVADEDGRFTAWTARGAVSFTAQAEGYAPSTVAGSAPGPEVEIHLTPASAVSGVVVVASNGEPVADLRVELMQVAGGALRPVARARTDAGGRFRFASLTPGRYKPRASGAGYFGQADEFRVGFLQTHGPIRIEVHPAVFATGTTTFEGEGCPGTVTLRREADGHVSSASADAQGRVVLGPLQAGTYSVTAQCPHALGGELEEPLVIADRSVEGLRWEMKSRGAAVRGVVVQADGTPVVGVQVHASASSPRASVRGLSDAWGQFELLGLPAGTYQISMSSLGGGWPTPDKTSVEVSEGQTVDGIELVLSPMARLSGTVRDRQRTPQGGVEVRVRQEGVGGLQGFTTASGAFSFPQVLPGVGWVQVRDPSHHTPLRPASGTGRAGGTGRDEGWTRYRTRAGETTEVHLVVEPLAGRITGRVTDADGGPVADAFVGAMRDARGGGLTSLRVLSSPWGPRRQVTDTDGGFAFELAPEGAYTVLATRADGSTAVAHGVEVGAEVALTLRALGAISGTVRLSDGEKLQRFSLALRLEAGPNELADEFDRAQGRWQLSGLQPGNYTVTALAPEGTASATVSLAAGETETGIDLVLVPRTTVRGRIVDLKTHEPVAGQHVQVGLRGGMASLGPPSAEGHGQTDAEGRFELRGVAAGEGTLSVSSSNRDDAFPYPFVQVPVYVAPRDGVALLGDVAIVRRRVKRLSRAGTLGYRIADPAADERAEARRLLVVEVDPNRSGTDGLAPGDEIIKVDGFDVSGARSYLYEPLVAVPGGTVLTLDLADERSVRLRVGPSAGA